jgi:hypothetical protein
LDAESSPGAKHRWTFFIRRRGDDIFQDFVNRQALMLIMPERTSRWPLSPGQQPKAIARGDGGRTLERDLEA